MQPLPGPGGLFTVSAMPRFLLDSSRVGWAGAHYADLDCARTGEVTHLHAHYSLQRILQPFRARRHASRAWRTVLPSTALWRPEDDQRFEWVGGGGRQFLTITAQRFEAVLDGRLPQLDQPSPFEPLRSPLVPRLMDALLMDLREGSPAGPLVGDALITALIAHLAAARPLESVGALAPAVRECIADYIAENLAQRISLDDLATVANLGIRHFCRAFRASFGASPHQYVVAQRVERARHLIVLGMSLSDVAASCGFADQSSLARTFSRHAGVTPSAFRASQHVRGRSRQS